jgi:hypothetical protein
MDPETFSQLVQLATDHKWLAASILTINLLVRLLKSPSVPAPLDKIPPNARPLLALLFGLVSGVLQHMAVGVPWRPALEQGLAAAALAVFLHQLGVEGALGGREPFAPTPASVPVPVPPEPVPIEPPPPDTLRGGS